MTDQQEDAHYHTQLSIRLQGNTYTQYAVGSTESDAQDRAATQLINQLDLFGNLPPVDPAMTTRRNTSQARHSATALYQKRYHGSSSRQSVKKKVTDDPLMAISARQVTAGAPKPKFIVSEAQNDPDNPQKKHACVLEVEDVDGTLYTAEGYGRNKDGARRMAAEAVFRLLPPRPLDKKGTMYPL